MNKMNMSLVTSCLKRDKSNEKVFNNYFICRDKLSSIKRKEPSKTKTIRIKKELKEKED